VTHPYLSVVVPLFNEEESVGPLVSAVEAALVETGWTWELLLVNDGSTDDTGARACAAADRDPRIRPVRLARNYGQTAAMQAGFDHARGAVVVSMDGDLQNDPLDIPRLVARLEEGFDMVAGYREHRQDSRARTIPSWFANRMIRGLTGVSIRDNGCSLKAYRSELLRQVHLYSDMHRFIPAIAAGTAGARITEIPVSHHPRRFGQSKYGFSRIVKVTADLATLTMIRSFRERPLALFSLIAAGAAAISTAGLMLFVAAPLIGIEAARRLVVPGIALLFLGLAAFLMMLGAVAEVVLRLLRGGPEAPRPVADSRP
jgi:glycosyltransferase involved in cell wall biosynthesis